MKKSPPPPPKPPKAVKPPPPNTACAPTCLWVEVPFGRGVAKKCTTCNRFQEPSERAK